MINIEKLNTGDILHCSGKRLISKIIKKATNSEFSHTALFIRIWDRPYIIDAQKDGVNLRPFNEWIDKYNYDFRVYRSPNLVQETSFAVRAMAKCGNTAYDLEGLLLKQPFELITGKWNNRGEKKEGDKMYCSEYVAWCYGWKESYKMSPKDLFNKCIAEGFTEIL